MVLVALLLSSAPGGASDVVVGGAGADGVRPVPATHDVPPPNASESSGLAARSAEPERVDGGVRVGVIGSSFDRSHAYFDGRVDAHRRVGDRLLAVEGGGEHDAAVAEVIADRSDSARLYLASVGHRPTPGEYDRAVEWLLDNDVSVIVDAGSYFPSTARGMARIATAAERAADSGAVFVTSAGNYAERHWRGTPAGAGWVSFDAAERTDAGGANGSESGVDTGAQGNRLGDGSTDGRVTLRLYWEGDADYDLYLYRDLPGRSDPVVGKSTRESGNAEAIDTTLPAGDYYVAVYARDPGRGAVDLFSASHTLEYTGTEGSAVAPATAEGVIAVGAVGADGRLEPYSSASDVNAVGGVSTDAAGRLSGTSAAAPLVAGTVIRMAESDAHGDLTSAEAERILRETADGASRRVDPRAAIASVGNVTTGGGRSGR
ncbi:peptidase S8 and S53 subtilisin kexin sedolisin [Candidatus Halobonum tyrrellensis G22]|uniref:Peptidase S8 and S53 subtilisin kexin sedolisin n=1 Tax=Candidatus Halobonum tyrrellensis G22 TaxID=1324957 RepID=V4GRF5_9EURY|nr:peptidase S8 and S53 subtilisin kexin sedolisin [Candidatus Halobonum tyrrellensis G22]